MVPPKAKYLRMESSDLEFEHYLAEHLGMTVARMRREMPNDEYVGWAVYYGRKAQRQQMEVERARS